LQYPQDKLHNNKKQQTTNKQETNKKQTTRFFVPLFFHFRQQTLAMLENHWSMTQIRESFVGFVACFLVD